MQYSEDNKHFQPLPNLFMDEQNTEEVCNVAVPCLEDAYTTTVISLRKRRSMKTYRLVAVNEFCAAEFLTNGLGLAFVAMLHVAACVTSYTYSHNVLWGGGRK